MWFAIKQITYKECYNMRSIKFKSARFGITVYENGSARWTVTNENGVTRVSNEHYATQEQAALALKKYLGVCKERADRGIRLWMTFQSLDPVTGQTRDIFYNGQ